MRASMLGLAGILLCAAAPAPAQIVIGVEGQKAAELREQDQAQPQIQPEAQVQSTEPALAQPKENPPALATGGGRFTFNRVDNGFLRLDNESGQVAYCSPQTAGWACQAVPEKQAALEADVARLKDELSSIKDLKAEISQLRDEVASLKRDVAALKAPPPPPRPPADLAPPADKGDDVTIKLPTQEDLARAREFVEKTLHHLVDMITAMQKDLIRKD